MFVSGSRIGGVRREPCIDFILLFAIDSYCGGTCVEIASVEHDCGRNIRKSILDAALPPDTPPYGTHAPLFTVGSHVGHSPRPR